MENTECQDKMMKMNLRVGLGTVNKFEVKEFFNV